GAMAGAVVAAVLPRAVRSAGPPCDPGLVDCGGSCVDILSDPGNCGGCGITAGPGGTCTNGQVEPQPGSNKNPPTPPPPTPAPPINPPLTLPTTVGCAQLGQGCSATRPCCQAVQGLFGQSGEQICSF